MEQLGVTFPILTEAKVNAYSTGGVPSSYLIGGDGSVIWQGHPSEVKGSTIEGHLKKIEKAHRVSTWAFTIDKNLPPLPKKLASVRGQLVKKSFGKALKKVESALKSLEGEDKDAGTTVRDWIAKQQSNCYQLN